MYIQQWIIALSLLGGILFGLAAALYPVRRLYLAIPVVVLFLLLVYEIRMDRWENMVTAPIRLDMFAEIPLMILCLIFVADAFVRQEKITLAVHLFGVCLRRLPTITTADRETDGRQQSATAPNHRLNNSSHQRRCSFPPQNSSVRIWQGCVR